MSDGWVPLAGSGNMAVPFSVQADPAAGPIAAAMGLPFMSADGLSVRLWFRTWKWERGAFVDVGTPSADIARLQQDLELEQAKGVGGFGVLMRWNAVLDTHLIDYYLTAQVSLDEARKVFLRWADERARDPRKPGDRVVVEDGVLKRRTVNTGHWDEFYKYGL